jgi:hydroxymethylbilane synthase
MRIGTRGSRLALWQAERVARLIADAGGPPTELVVIRTSGDERAPSASPPDAPRSGSGAVKRMFVKEIEDALVDGRIDLAVHSSKDLPAVLPGGLHIGAALTRADPRDAVVLPATAAVRGWSEVKATLAAPATIGTSSVRRVAALRGLFPKATFSPVRGNVDTRLRKLDEGQCGALVLAAAGLERLGLESRISAAIPIDVLVPAPGQGIIAIEIADGASAAVRDIVSRLDDGEASEALSAERTIVCALGGGCQLPLGAFARVDAREIDLTAILMSTDGTRVVRGRRAARVAARPMTRSPERATAAQKHGSLPMIFPCFRASVARPSVATARLVESRGATAHGLPCRRGSRCTRSHQRARSALSAERRCRHL